jgi:hypothetical protein
MSVKLEGTNTMSEWRGKEYHHKFGKVHWNTADTTQPITQKESDARRHGRLNRVVAQ